MARSNATSGRKQHRNAAAGVVQNKVTSPAVKFTDLRAAAGQRISVLGAKMGQKMVHLRADVALGFYRIRHPIHPVRRVAAAEATKEMKAAATERRRQKEARARDNAARQRAVVRERRAYNMAKHT